MADPTFAESQASQASQAKRLGSMQNAGRAELLAELERLALQLHTEHSCEVGVIVLEQRGVVRAFGTADEVVGEDFVETVTRVAELEPVLHRYREVTSTFDGADPGCAKCAGWRRSQTASTSEMRKRNSMTELLSVPSAGSSESSPAPVRAELAAAAAEQAALEAELDAAELAAATAAGWGDGLARQARGLCRLVEPWLGDLAAAAGNHSDSERVCRVFIDAIVRGERANGDASDLPTGLARGLRITCGYRSANRKRLLALAREVCDAIIAEYASVASANKLGHSLSADRQTVDYAAALSRHYSGVAPTIYDWTDRDLPDMIIAQLPARKVLADGPRLTNT